MVPLRSLVTQRSASVFESLIRLESVAVGAARIGCCELSVVPVGLGVLSACVGGDCITL